MGQGGMDAWSANGERSRARVRVFLVDDHVLFRTGLRALLEANGLEAVGDVGDAEQAFDPILRLRPDVVLMDLSLPGLSGVEATRRLTALIPDVQILIFTAHTGDQAVVDAVRAGACGYLLKDAPTDDLVRAIEAAARGQASLSPGATTVVLDRLRAYRDAPSRSRVPNAETDLTETDLSWRELEVLALLVEGKENVEIAQALSISPQTVKNHISSILAKLKVPNRTLAAVEAVWRGLV
jgi:DNA-binding NarL/FixJ family response regulator